MYVEHLTDPLYFMFSLPTLYILSRSQPILNRKQLEGIYYLSNYFAPPTPTCPSLITYTYRMSISSMKAETLSSILVTIID